MVDAASFLSLALDQLIQSLAVAILLKMVLSSTPGSPADLRCRWIGLAIVASVLMPMCAFLPDWAHLHGPVSFVRRAMRPELLSSAATGKTPGDQLGKYLLAIWAIGATLGVLRIGVEMRQLILTAREAVMSTEFALPGVSVMLSDTISRPVLFGYARQVVLLPSELGNHLSPENLRALLAHEYAHVERGDTFVALGQRVLAALLWWNPIIHWMNGLLNDEREKACDAIAATACGSPAQFACALVDYARLLVEGRSSNLAVGVAAKGSQLSNRVHYLLRPGSEVAVRPLSAAVCALATLGLAVIAVATPRITIAANIPQSESDGESTLIQAEEHPIQTIEGRPAPALRPAVEQKITHVQPEGRIAAHADSKFDDLTRRARGYREYNQLSRQFQPYDRTYGQYRQQDAIALNYARYDRIGDRYRALDAIAQRYSR